MCKKVKKKSSNRLFYVPKGISLNDHRVIRIKRVAEEEEEEDEENDNRISGKKI